MMPKLIRTVSKTSKTEEIAIHRILIEGPIGCGNNNNSLIAINIKTKHEEGLIHKNKYSN